MARLSVVIPNFFMSTKRSSKAKRERGVILTMKGWQKLQLAMQAAEATQNWGQRFTREQLSDRTVLSLQTISRILKREAAVDRQSIESFLRRFDLQLSQEDCAIPVSLEGRLTQLMACLQHKRCLLILDNAETLLRIGS